MAEDEHSIRRRVAESGDEAFAELFRSVMGRLETWISAHVDLNPASQVTLDDVLRDTFVEAHRGLERLAHEDEAAFRRRVFAVARSRLRELRDASATVIRGRIAPRDDELRMWRSISCETSSANRGARRIELARRLGEAIRRLPEDLREVLLMRSVERVSTKEVAAILDRSPATVQGLYARAVRKLRDELRPAAQR